MPPLPRRLDATPRVILYHQTHHQNGDQLVPLKPLLSTPLTHLILAAIHLNKDDANPHITLNDHHPSDARNNKLWPAVRELQDGGIKVLGMLGGAAKGSFQVLDWAFTIAPLVGQGGEERFETYYTLLHNFVKERQLDGLDLDVEEEMSLPGIIRLVDRLKRDFGPDFIITLAPVAAALYTRDPRGNLSGFDYAALDSERGESINWYNTQFYNGWGDAKEPQHYFACLAQQFDPEKVVMGVLTNQANGPSGFVEMGVLIESILSINEMCGNMGKRFGGVMGWEYFNAETGMGGGPEAWAEILGALLGVSKEEREFKAVDEMENRSARAEHEQGQQKVLKKETKSEDDVEVPSTFEYFSESETA